MRSLLASAPRRCGSCRLPARWCICSAHRDLQCPLAIDVLMHVREQYRPSSTGLLIRRVFSQTRLQLWPHDQPVSSGEIAIHLGEPELWILHPQGEPWQDEMPGSSRHVVLIDGSWSEAAQIARAYGSRGRLLSLPMTGDSRYWLRNQQDGGRYSTAEALMFLLRALGWTVVHDEFRLQFELHVYANLRARGRKQMAERYLAESPVARALPEMIAQLNQRRPRET